MIQGVLPTADVRVLLAGGRIHAPRGVAYIALFLKRRQRSAGAMAAAALAPPRRESHRVWAPRGRKGTIVSGLKRRSFYPSVILLDSAAVSLNRAPSVSQR